MDSLTATTTLDPNPGVEEVQQLTPPADDGGQGAEGTQTAEPEAGHEAEPGTEGGKGTQQETQEDGRLIPQWMRGLKEANPEAYKQAKGLLFPLKSYQGVYPTVEAAKADRDLVQSLGGREGVDQLQEDASVFKTAAEQFLKGDPAFVEDLFTEDPIAAALHIPAMLEAFSKHDKEGYNTTVARIFNTELGAVGFNAGVQSLIKAIQAKNTDVALQIATDIKNWQEGITGVASKAEDPRVKTLLAERAKARETEANSGREAFLNSYKTESITEVAGLAEKAFSSYFRNSRMEESDRKDLIRDALRIANEEVVADTTFLQQRDKHLSAGNRVAAKQLTTARYNQAIPNAVARVARRYGLKTAAAQPNNQQQQNQQPKGQPQVAQGWVRINARPENTSIDRDVTSTDMILSGKAILKDGKKVDWSHLQKRPA